MLAHFDQNENIQADPWRCSRCVRERFCSDLVVQPRIRIRIRTNSAFGDTATAFGLRFPPSAIRTDGRTHRRTDKILAVRMVLANTFLKGFLAVRMVLANRFFRFFSCPHGPREHLFEGFLAVRMVLANTFLKNISGPGVSALRPKSDYFQPWC